MIRLLGKIASMNALFVSIDIQVRRGLRNALNVKACILNG